MDSHRRAVFRAIHEGKWLYLEYQNRSGQLTKFWGAVLDLDCRKGLLKLYGMHIRDLSTAELTLNITSITHAEIIEGTCCDINEALVQDMADNAEYYLPFFGQTGKLRILNYLEMCYKMDSTPYCNDFELVRYLDNQALEKDVYPLSHDQFKTVVALFQKCLNTRKSAAGKRKHVINRLVMNMLSIHTPKGLYVLAYRELNFDIQKRCLRPDKQVTVCREFLIDGSQRETVRRFLDADEWDLLDDFTGNAEAIKDAIAARNPLHMVDDIPVIMGLSRQITVDLNREYRALEDRMAAGESTIPIKAFFGELLDKPRRNKNYPIVLADNRINLDQLLAIHHAMKYPTAYVQGPPGTGKTSTIINTILTAYFNDKTVLFSSYNNHPLDDVLEKFRGLRYEGRPILFPFLRIGNQDVVQESIRQLKSMLTRADSIKVFGKTLDKRREDRAERAGKLSAMLKAYEELLDLRERRETLDCLLDFNDARAENRYAMPFLLELSGQKNRVEEAIASRDHFTEEQAARLLDKNTADLFQYLFYISAKFLKRLQEPKYAEFRGILEEQDEEEQTEAFNRYIQDPDKLKMLLKVFPVVVSTCLSAARLGDPEPVFDMVIMDEASQCNTAVSLIPIIRGHSLMLVGDPQQLNPVILLDKNTNQALRKKYQVGEEYDYRDNSIYKSFLACDSVSDEILLHNHYRCHEKIIGFNNKKYYHSKLKIKSQSREESPLVFVDVPEDRQPVKNTSEQEADQIIHFVEHNPGASVGIITPFVNQKNLIARKLRERGLGHIPCGTVHSFQGDEKDVILFSTAVGKGTAPSTYKWISRNRELINVATSRARNKLVVLGNLAGIRGLHQEAEDDFYELVQYVKENGNYEVIPKDSHSRALGVKPFSTETEEAFLTSLTHAMGNIWLSGNRFSVKKEVPISQVFEADLNEEKLFYTGRFDFVIYEKQGKKEFPVLAIELDGKEHFEDVVVQRRDRRKEAICRSHDLQLIRVENVYARRYEMIKHILAEYFEKRR